MVRFLTKHCFEKGKTSFWTESLFQEEFTQPGCKTLRYWIFNFAGDKFKEKWDLKIW